MTEHVPALHLTDPTVLVTLTGTDQSGVTTRLFDDLAAYRIEVIDIGQLVVRGRLILSALLTIPDDRDGLERTVRAVGETFGLDVSVEYGFVALEREIKDKFRLL